MPRITLIWQGQPYEVEASPETPLYEVLKSLGLPAGTTILAAKTPAGIHELAAPVNGHTQFRLLSWDDPEGKYVFWHSSAHILAEALESFWPHCKLTIGPPIEQGFYYDVDFGGNGPSPEDFEKIEKKFWSSLRSQSTFAERSSLGKRPSPIMRNAKTRTSRKSSGSFPRRSL